MSWEKDSITAAEAASATRLTSIIVQRLPHRAPGAARLFAEELADAVEAHFSRGSSTDAT
ncbi:hypothetical protein AKJ09_00425 [Labilithrix luteola]|uniref:Uncharacterized protein n=1 Tax=Labilithrix luteola TaxID=1391654 RepID=A0A0K1PK47_9BACT|nr:hypothetical protein AKJ09_00425 [Labilithrix luteola]